jgi:hypothetical protein
MVALMRISATVLAVIAFDYDEGNDGDDRDDRDGGADEAAISNGDD